MFCSNCGKELSGNVKFCDNCGAQQNLMEQTASQNESEEKNRKVKSRSKAKFYLGIALFVFGAMFIIWPLFFPQTMSMCDDGLDKTEIASLIVCVLAFGGSGAWLIHKNKK